MPRSASPFRERTFSKVAKRIGIPEHELRRAASHGSLKTESWAGVTWIEASEERRIKELADRARQPISDAPAEK